MSGGRYAGSEAHLAELMDKVCDLMQNYGTTTDPKTGERGFMRINSRAGETITISNVNFSSGGTQELRAAVRYWIFEFLKANLRFFSVYFETHK